MPIKQAAEMWEASEGGEMPADFARTVETYMKCKCVFGPLQFTPEDFAACMLNYKLYKSFVKKGAKRDEQ